LNKQQPNTKGMKMNARFVLDDYVRKRVAHLRVDQIRVLTARLESQTLQLRIFLKLFDRLKPARKHRSLFSPAPSRMRLN